MPDSPARPDRPRAPDPQEPDGRRRGGRRANVLRRRDELEARATATRDELRDRVAATRAQIDATNARVEARAGRNLPRAIGFGLIIGLSMMLSLIFVKSLFMIVCAVLVTFTSIELASALRFAGRDVPRIPTVIAALAMVPATFYFADEGKWFAFLGGVLLVALWRIAEMAVPVHRATLRELWKDIGAGTLIQGYVVFLGGFGVLLTAREGGEWWTLAFLIIVLATDIGAYASGLLYGKHPMAPRISPKKTWEGFAGSVAAAVIAGILLSVFMIQMEWWFGIVFGLTMVATATIGDLTESLIKRDLGIKDISTWLPGHGGFLDRLDSILPSAAAAYALYVLFA